MKSIVEMSFFVTKRPVLVSLLRPKSRDIPMYNSDFMLFFRSSNGAVIPIVELRWKRTGRS